MFIDVHVLSANHHQMGIWCNGSSIFGLMDDKQGIAGRTFEEMGRWLEGWPDWPRGDYGVSFKIPCCSFNRLFEIIGANCNVLGKGWHGVDTTNRPLGGPRLQEYPAFVAPFWPVTARNCGFPLLSLWHERASNESPALGSLSAGPGSACWCHIGERNPVWGGATQASDW